MYYTRAYLSIRSILSYVYVSLIRGSCNFLQSMEATKCLLRKTMNEKLRQQLSTEAKLLREHWSSDECQRRFKDYLQQEALLQNK